MTFRKKAMRSTHLHLILFENQKKAENTISVRLFFVKSTISAESALFWTDLKKGQ